MEGIDVLPQVSHEVKVARTVLFRTVQYIPCLSMNLYYIRVIYCAFRLFPLPLRFIFPQHSLPSLFIVYMLKVLKTTQTNASLKSKIKNKTKFYKY